MWSAQKALGQSLSSRCPRDKKNAGLTGCVFYISLLYDHRRITGLFQLLLHLDRIFHICKIADLDTDIRTGIVQEGRKSLFQQLIQQSLCISPVAESTYLDTEAVILDNSL